MTPAYIELVWNSYKLKSSKDDASFNLKNPTRANLKSESYKVCNDRFSRKDGSILKKFFGEGDDKEQLLLKIDELVPDHYAALRNFMRDKTPNPMTKTVEILAWLIDFQPRPYQSNVDYQQLFQRMQEANSNLHEEDYGNWFNGGLSDEENSVEGEKELQNNIDGDSKDVQLGLISNITKVGDDKASQSDRLSTGKEIGWGLDETDHPKDGDQKNVISKEGETVLTQSPKPRLQKWMFILVGSILTTVISFLLYNNSQSVIPMGVNMNTGEPARPVNCMIWSIDHYEAIPCDYRYDDGDAIALDSVVLRKLKMIIHPELISIEDLDRVWYNKYNNKVEYFTDSGVHPVNKKPLRQLSTHIYTTHIVPLRDSLSRR